MITDNLTSLKCRIFTYVENRLLEDIKEDSANRKKNSTKCKHHGKYRKGEQQQDQCKGS